MTQQKRLPDSVAQSLQAIINYLWQEEQNDFESREGEVKEHILLHLRQVTQWLDYDPER